ncbi:MAG: hypothetical protein ABIF17_04050, partial [Patescibacteria group bacterium]
LLLLIPGFWIFSVRLMLGVPATFAIALIIYLLLKKAPFYQIVLSVLLLLLTKEYYFYITMPMLLGILLIDAWKNEQKIYLKIFIFIKNSIIIYFPSIIVIIILIDFNLFPYPRLLENSITFIFGDFYSYFNKMFLSIINRIVEMFNTNSDFQPTSTVLEGKIDSIKIVGEIPTGMIHSQTAQGDYGFFMKLWLLYKYNFSENDINIFILPLAFFGLGLRIKKIFKNFKLSYKTIRADIIFLFFFSAFAYFNFHEASGIHGFRITIPIILCLIYFSYFGLKKILYQYSKKNIIIFSSIFAFFLILYWFSIRDLAYGSILANASILNVLISYKPYLFIALFIILFIFIIYFSKIKNPIKYKILLTVVLFLFVIKFIPFYINNNLNLDYYGYNYGMDKARPVLQKLKNTDSKIYSNFNAYKVQYYASDIRIVNKGFTMTIRKFNQKYPRRYISFPLDENLINYIEKYKIDYVLLVNDQYNNKDLMLLKEIIAANKKSFQKIEDSYHNGRLQWILYQVTL